ncbi:MAG TPA: hypothetical protein ENJ95_15415 [Bacteroidetes bacterium]|nr:hypothetical protein [Bacteroidota bacterium]
MGCYSSSMPKRFNISPRIYIFAFQSLRKPEFESLRKPEFESLREPEFESLREPEFESLRV